MTTRRQQTMNNLVAMCYEATYERRSKEAGRRLGMIHLLVCMMVERFDTVAELMAAMEGEVKSKGISQTSMRYTSRMNSSRRAAERAVKVLDRSRSGLIDAYNSAIRSFIDTGMNDALVADSEVLSRNMDKFFDTDSDSLATRLRKATDQMECCADKAEEIMKRLETEGLDMTRPDTRNIAGTFRRMMAGFRTLLTESEEFLSSYLEVAYKQSATETYEEFGRQVDKFMQLPEK